jgi:hypothetical protein
MATDMIVEMIDRLYNRKSEMNSAKQDIAKQQSELDERRSHVEGRLCEIEYYIAMIEENRGE